MRRHNKNRFFLFFLIFILLFSVVPNSLVYTVFAATEDLSTYTESDTTPERISLNTNGSQVNITSMKNTDDNLYLVKDLESANGYEASDWSLSFEIFSPNSNVEGQRGTRLLGAGFSDGLGDVTACGVEYWCGIYITTASPYLNRMRLGKSASTGQSGTVNLGENQWYYAYFNRSADVLTYSLYTSATRTDANLVETLTYENVSTDSFKYFYAAQSLDIDNYGNNQESWKMRNYELTVSGCLEPDAPTNGVIDYDEAATTINLTWTKGNNANNTVVRYKTTGYPTSITDGTLWYNGTLTYYENNSINTGQHYYIRAWSESNWSNPDGYKISDDYLQFDYGSMTINVYDENTSAELDGWDIFVTNSDKSETYENTTVSNPLVVPVSTIPYGTDTRFVFNLTGYDSRIYYMDTLTSEDYSLNVYLTNESDTESYVIRVIDELGSAVDKSKVYVMRYINSSVGWENVSIMLTNGYGFTPSIDLIPYEDYAVKIVKTGYDTAFYDLRPVNIVFDDDRYHPFQIYLSVSDPQVVSFSSIIDFCEDTGWVRSNDTLHISFFDRDSGTSDITINVYEFYNGTLYLNDTFSYTDTYDIDIWVSGLNTSRMHDVMIISMNHSTLGNPTRVSCMVFPLTKITQIPEGDIETKFDNVGGDFSMGYVNFFILFLPSFLIILALRGDPGLGILVSSFYLTLVTWRIDLVNVKVVASIVSVLIPLGILRIVVKRGRKIT